MKMLMAGCLDDAVQEERKAGIRTGLAWLSAADELWYDGSLGISAGMAAEIAEARKRGIRVVEKWAAARDAPPPRCGCAPELVGAGTGPLLGAPHEGCTMPMGHTNHCAARMQHGDGECECRPPVAPMDGNPYSALRDPMAEPMP